MTTILSPAQKMYQTHLENVANQVQKGYPIKDVYKMREKNKRYAVYPREYKKV